MKNGAGILEIINNITLNGESGRLEINSSGAHGSLIFNEGKLVDATLGSLSGFAAVNAAVALPNPRLSFVHVIYPPHSPTIGPSERVVLKRFFGIEAAEIDETRRSVDSEIGWNLEPEQVVPLTEVEENDLQDTPTIEAERIPAPVAAIPPVITQNSSHRARLALYLVLILALTAGAVGLIAKLGARPQVASVATTVESQPAPESSSAEVKEEPVTQPEQKVAAVTKSPVVSHQPRTPERSESPSSPDDSDHLAMNPQDLTGEWNVMNTVQETAYKPYDTMQIGFRLRIKQTGKDFTATGEKFSENGRNLPANGRTPIHVTGSVDGDKVVATFVEDGMTRRTNGRFEWRLQTGGAGLTGTFASTAANSKGKSAATKQP